MAIYDYLKNLVYGMPGADMNQATRGLLGSGGQGGGGYIQGLLQNPNFTSGIGLLSSGLRGEDPSTALLKVSQVQQSQAAVKKAKAFEDLLNRDDLSVREKAYLAAGITPPRASDPSLSAETLAVYQKMKGLQGSDFNQAFASLSKAEQDLYNNKIKPNISFLDSLTQGEITKSQEKATGKVPNLESWLEQARKQNPNVSDKELTDFYNKKYGK